MNIKDKVVKNAIRKLGIDLSDPKKLIFKTIKDIIDSSVPSIMKSKEMVDFLNDRIDELKDEFGA